MKSKRLKIHLTIFSLTLLTGTSIFSQKLENTKWNEITALVRIFKPQNYDSVQIEFKKNNEMLWHYKGIKDTFSRGTWWQIDSNHFKFVDFEFGFGSNSCAAKDTDIVKYSIRNDTFTFDTMIGCKVRRVTMNKTQMVNITNLTSNSIHKGKKHYIIFPNPVKNNIVYVTSSGISTFRLLDCAGRVLETGQLKNGLNEIYFQTKNLKGIYFLSFDGIAARIEFNE